MGTFFAKFSRVGFAAHDRRGRLAHSSQRTGRRMSRVPLCDVEPLEQRLLLSLIKPAADDEALRPYEPVTLAAYTASIVQPSASQNAGLYVIGDGAGGAGLQFDAAASALQPGKSLLGTTAGSPSAEQVGVADLRAVAPDLTSLPAEAPCRR